jgi:zinc transporter ZupT
MQNHDILKIIFIIVAFFEAFLMGLLPVKCIRCRKSLAILGIANAFSAGVFVAIALLHIMPE